MSGGAGRRWPPAAAAAGVVLVAAGLAWLVVVWVRKGATAAAPQASVLGVALAAAGAGIGLLRWGWRRRRAASLPATAEQLDQAGATLAGLVLEQWLSEAQARSLADPEPMPLRWRLSSPELMDHPTVISPDGPLVFAARSDRPGRLTEAFRALPRRRLVITGGPGTGKTTLAVQLLLELLTHPQPGDLVPVLFSLASWAPEAQPRVQDWLIGQLELGYPALRAIASDTAAALIAQGRILPILDGLDEVSPMRRAGIIAALNTSLPPGSGLILTSRRGEYRGAVTAAGDVLTAAAVISPLALTCADAATYLGKHLPPGHDTAWDQVLGELDGGRAPNLAAVTATPLGLWLVRAVYLDGRLDPTPLIDTTHPTRAALQAHLLNELIPTVLRSRPPAPRRRADTPDTPLRPTHHYQPEDMRRWLTTLAGQLRDAVARDWLWWQLALHTFPTTPGRLALRLAIGLVFGLTFGLVFGMVFGLVFGLTFGLVGGLVGGLAPFSAP